MKTPLVNASIAMMTDAGIDQFLYCATPTSWLEYAAQTEQLPALLIDHLICELKAAQTAMWLIRSYAIDKSYSQQLLAWLLPYEDFIYRQRGDAEQLLMSNGLSKNQLHGLLLASNAQDGAFQQDLFNKMILLIKEELHHFGQVLAIMQQRNIAYQKMTAGRYAKGLMQMVRTHEPATLIDKLICGAYIEARSCERFARLIPYVDLPLAQFYHSLLRSEARHYQDYLQLAQQIAEKPLTERIALIGQREAELILQPDQAFRFHSGQPVSVLSGQFNS